jgi:hypothetical protein
MTQKTSRRGFLKTAAAGAAVALAGCATTKTYDEARLLRTEEIPSARTAKAAEPAPNLDAKVDEAVVQKLYEPVAPFSPNSGSGTLVTMLPKEFQQAYGREVMPRRIDFAERGRTGQNSRLESIANLTDLINSFESGLRQYAHLQFASPQMVGGIKGAYVITSRETMPSILFHAYTTKGYDGKLNGKDETVLYATVTDKEPSEFQKKVKDYRKPLEFAINAALSAAGAAYTLDQPLVGFVGCSAQRTAKGAARGVFNLMHEKPHNVNLYPDNRFDSQAETDAQKFWNLLQKEGVDKYTFIVPIQGEGGRIDTYLLLTSDRPTFGQYPEMWAKPNIDPETGYVSGITMKTPRYKGENLLESVAISMIGSVAKGFAEGAVSVPPKPETQIYILPVPIGVPYGVPTPPVTNLPQIGGSGHFGPGVTGDVGAGTNSGGPGIGGGSGIGDGVTMYMPTRREILFYGQRRNA